MPETAFIGTSIGEPAFFSAVFAPRVLDVRAPAGGGSGRFEVRLAHFDRLAGRFKEASVGVWLEREEVGRIDPPVVPVREFQQALKRFYAESLAHRAATASGEVPRQALKGVLNGIEGRLAQRRNDGARAPGKIKRASDRMAAQMELQGADRWAHRLVVLGRYHRRRGDFLGGEVAGIPQTAFGYTTGNGPGDILSDPNEDALGIDRVGNLEIFAVADGHHGARSSELAVGKLLELFRLGFEGESQVTEREIQNFLMHAFARCHGAITMDLQSERSKTSLLGVVRKDRRLWWASVGDSFLFRAVDGQIGRVNRDLGFEVSGSNQSIWLGDKRFHTKFIDRGADTVRDRCFILTTDGILTHPQYRVRPLIGQLAAGSDLNTMVQRISRDYAISARDNTAFIVLRGTRGNSAG